MFDIAYVARVLTLALRVKVKGKYDNLFSESIVRGSCWPNDLDINWHMNNARFLRECDFGRIAFIFNTGLWDAILKRRKSGLKNANIVVSALQVQFRQSIALGDRFEIRTRLDGWDDRAFYIEHAIILDKNKQPVFSLLVRQASTVRSLTPQMLVDDLQIGTIQSPPLSAAMENFRQNHRLTYSGAKSKL